MKKTILTAIISLSICSLNAQITITSQDMPTAGGTYRVSIGIISPGLDITTTGPAQTWDFSALQFTTQEVDTFQSVSSAGATYALFFADVPFNPNRSNLATSGGTTPNVPSIPGSPVSISDVFSFYYKSSASYQQSGFGASINGSVGVPIPFDTKDRIYSFPLNFGDNDSSFSDYEISLPGLGYYGHEQVRLSEVDGWGTLITPFGTFNTLRVKSVIEGTDTLFLDTLGFGFGFNAPTITEYKWLGTQKGIPLLQINTTQTFFGTEMITSVRYQDSIRTTGLEENASISAINLFPNPSNGNFAMFFNMSSVKDVQVSIFSTDGKLIGNLYKGTLQPGANHIPVDGKSMSLPAGYYIIRADIGSASRFEKLVITHQE